MSIDFKGIQTTGNRPYRFDYIENINAALEDIPIKQRVTSGYFMAITDYPDPV